MSGLRVLQRAQRMVVDGSPRWEVYRALAVPLPGAAMTAQPAAQPAAVPAEVQFTFFPEGTSGSSKVGRLLHALHRHLPHAPARAVLVARQHTCVHTASACHPNPTLHATPCQLWPSPYWHTRLMAGSSALDRAAALLHSQALAADRVQQRASRSYDAWQHGPAPRPHPSPLPCRPSLRVACPSCAARA